jgi:hypothetical protein
MLLIGVEALNFSGFCWSDMKYRSDATLIDDAVERTLKLYSPQLGPITKRYTSLAEFHQLNPHCCILYRWGHLYASDFRLLGIYRAVADLAQ